MYRAFIGSNHAPIINVVSPTANSIIPSYQNLVVSYTVNDWDLKDRNITTGFTFKYSDGTEKVMMPEQTVHTGNVVNLTFDNPLPQGGDMSVEITARDKQGAIVKQSVPVKIQKVTANIQTDRTISSNVVNGKVSKNEPVTLHYTVTPKPIPYYVEKNPIQISNIRFNEVFPPNLQISSATINAATGTITQTGTLESGYTLTGTLNPITYRASSDKKSYIADPVTFDITVIPTQNGVYSLTNSTLTFLDIGAKQPITVPFQSFVFEAVTRLTKLWLQDTTLIVGDTLPLIAKFEPEDATNKNFDWVSDKPGVVSVDPITGIINANSVGEAQITVKATDGSGVTGSAKVTVIQPDLIISGPNTVNKGEQITLVASLPLVNQKVNSITWVPKENGYIELTVDPSDSGKVTVKGQNSGTATIVVTATTENENTHAIRTYTKEYQVTVINPLQGISIKGDDQVDIGRSIDLEAILNPLDADGQDKLVYHWQFTDSSGGTLATLSGADTQTASLKGLKPGTVTVTVSAGGKSTSKNITINPLKTLALPPKLQLHEKEKYNLMADLFPRDLSDEIKSSLVWSSDNSAIVSILAPNSGPSGGGIEALKAGTTKVRVAYSADPSVYAYIEIEVVKVSSGDRY
ncbi:Bacterial Ig-like domain (group 2) [compost metagenome]